MFGIDGACDDLRSALEANGVRAEVRWYKAEGSGHYCVSVDSIGDIPGVEARWPAVFRTEAEAIAAVRGWHAGVNMLEALSGHKHNQDTPHGTSPRMAARKAYLAERDRQPHWQHLRKCDPGSQAECEAWCAHEEWRDRNPLWLAWVDAAQEERVELLQ